MKLFTTNENSGYFIRETYSELPKLIKIGMTKAEVSRFLPNPHNIDNEYVWFWIVEYKKYKQKNLPFRWNDMVNESGGYFLIFLDNKLALGFWKTSSNTPGQRLRASCDYKITEDEANEILEGKNNDKYKMVLTILKEKKRNSPPVAVSNRPSSSE